MGTRTFVEFTPKGKKIKVKRFYYDEEKAWFCADCYHVGKEFIIASIPCKRCEKGITQMAVSNGEN